MMEDQAIDWVIRLRDPAFDDWETFEDWLTADPAHADIYHAMALADEGVPEMLVAPQAPATPAKVRSSRRVWLGAALAASIAAVVGYGMIGAPHSSPYQIETAPGVRRLVALEDGSSITLNGGTRLTLDRKNDRIATLDRGEALFAVVHDTSRPFRVTVGAATIVDVGTRFNVVRAGTETRVAVSEGAVVYNPDSEAVRLNVGRRLKAVDRDPTIMLGDIAPVAVAGWKNGRLVYDGQPMREVAADLARYYGQPIRVSPSISSRPYHGVLSLEADGNLARLGGVLDARIERDGPGWSLSGRE